MKKKILLLILSTFIIKGSCTPYLEGVVQFCPEVEQQCFMNMLNTDLQSQVLSSALNCSIITDAISGTPDLNSLQNNASTIVKDILMTYLLNHGTSGCDSLVQTYLEYSKKPENCGGSIMNQCSSMLGSSCDVHARNIAEIINFARQSGLIDFGKKVGDVAVGIGHGVVDFGNSVKDGVVDFGKSVKDGWCSVFGC